MLQKWIKRTFMVLAVIILLVAAFILLIHTPKGKAIVKKRIESYLQKKLQTYVRINRIDYRLPLWLELKDVLIKDKFNDTLLNGSSLLVNLSMLKLMQNDIQINNINLDNINLYVNRTPTDSNFNYQFVIDAFTSPKDTSAAQKPTQLTLKKIILHDIHFRYNDGKEKMYYDARIGNLETNIDKFDITNLKFAITDWNISHSNIAIVDSSGIKKIKAFTTNGQVPASLLLQLNKLGLRDIQLDYRKISDSLAVSSTIDSFQLDNSALNLAHQSITCDNLILKNSIVKLTTATARKKDINDTATVADWNITANNIDLNNNSIIYHNNLFKPSDAGIDYNHLVIKNLGLQAKQTHYAGTNIRMELLTSSLVANDKLFVKNMKGMVNVTDDLVEIKDVELIANNSKLVATGDLYWPLSATHHTATNASISTHIDNSYVTYSDILLFAPSFKQQLPVELSINERIFISGNLAGTIGDLHFTGLRISVSSEKFNLIANGHLQNIADPANLNYNVSINRLYINKNLLSPSVLKKWEANNINLPPSISISGVAKGNLRFVSTDLSLNSIFGQAHIKGDVKNFNNNNMDMLQYNMQLTATNLETGKWINRDSLLGKLTGSVAIKGTGTNTKKMVADVKLLVRSFVLNGYDYSNIAFTGNTNKGEYAVVGRIEDENLITSLDVKGNFTDRYPSGTGNIRVSKAVLDKLHLTNDSITVSTNITLDAPSLDPRALHAVIVTDSNVVTIHGTKYLLDSLTLAGNSNADSSRITLQSPFVKAELYGQYNYDQLPQQISAYIDRNYMDQPGTVAFTEQQAKLDAAIAQHQLLTQLFPKLEISKPITIHAAFDNRQKDTVLSLTMVAPAMIYDQFNVEELSLTAKGADSLRFFITSKDLLTNHQSYHAPQIIGSFRNNQLQLIAKSFDANGKEFYSANGSVDWKNDQTSIRLKDGLTLNSKKWNVTNNNEIIIRKDGYIIDHFILSNGNQSVSINSQSASVKAPIDVKVDSLQIVNILSFMNSDTLLADGKLQINATIQQPIQSFPVISGTAGIKGLTFRKTPIGDVSLRSSSMNKIVTFNGNLSGNNRVNIEGNINTDASTLDVAAHLQQLNANSIEAFSNGAISRTSGNITGDLNIKGPFQDPRWNGVINFDTVAFAITQFNSLYTIRKQKIIIEHPLIKVDQFELSDSLGNVVYIDGTAKGLPNYEFGFSLDIWTTDFLAINTPRKPESLLYGTGVVDATITLSGTSIQPSLEGSIVLKNNSRIHYVVPKQSDFRKERENVLEFIKIDTLHNMAGTNLYTSKDTLFSSSFRGLKYNLNLEVNKEAELTLLLDPETNDELVIKGAGELNAGIDENGQIGIIGVYRLDSGYYNMRYQFLKRQFQLQEGSTVTFGGDPQDAIVDITAHYEVLASAIDLLGSEIGESTANLGTTYSQKIPFVVILNIKGPMLKPELSFDIKLKEGAAGVNTSLAGAIENKLDQMRYDVSAMNKQVFGLLIMNRFIGQQSFDFFAGSGNSFNFNDAAKESVSRFLTEGVNQLAKDLIRGVDINFNLRNYRSVDNSITRTDLDLSLSKQLLDDRLTVTLGQNFQLAGNDQTAKTNQTSNMQFAPDISVGYKISRNGRYMLRGYRRNAYEAILDGYFIETGITFSIVVDYNQFKEIFQRTQRSQPSKIKRP